MGITDYTDSSGPYIYIYTSSTCCRSSPRGSRTVWPVSQKHQSSSGSDERKYWHSERARAKRGFKKQELSYGHRRQPGGLGRSVKGREGLKKKGKGEVQSLRDRRAGISGRWRKRRVWNASSLIREKASSASFPDFRLKRLRSEHCTSRGMWGRRCQIRFLRDLQEDEKSAGRRRDLNEISIRETL